MAGTTGSDSDNECPVCHEPYTVPKLLPCNHLACRDCVRSWLNKGGQGGCPLCRHPILPPTQPGQGQLDALVDALPTDLLALSLSEGQQLLTGPHVCPMCPHNVAALVYCLQCAVKLCRACSDYHSRLPVSKDHSLQDLNTLTAQDLSAGYPSLCQSQSHDSRAADVFCSSHQDLCCWECATTLHRGCEEVKVISEVAKEKRREVDQQVQRWRGKEAALAIQIQSRKDTFNQQHANVKTVLDHLRQHLQTRRQELYDVIQKRQDDDADLEKLRATVTSHVVTMERLLRSPNDGILLQMTKKLEPRCTEVEVQCGRADSTEAVPDLQLDRQSIAAIKTALSALGHSGDRKAVLLHHHLLYPPPHTFQQQSQWSPHPPALSLSHPLPSPSLSRTPPSSPPLPSQVLHQPPAPSRQECQRPLSTHPPSPTSSLTPPTPSSPPPPGLQGQPLPKC